MDKLKVLQVNKLYYPHTGGIEKVVQQVAEGLKDRTDMKVLVCQEKGVSRTDIVNDIMVRRAGSLGIAFSLPISFPFLWELRKMSKDRDILHFHMPFPLGDLGCLMSGFKGKVIVWWHSDIVRQKFLMKLYRPLMDRFLKRADVIIVATQGHIDGSDYLPKYRDKCVIIPFGVDKAIEQKADEFFRVAQSVKREKVQLLFVGRLVYYKGCDVLIQAFRNVTGAELTIIGSGELEEDLKHQVKELGLSETVHFMGNVDDDQVSRAFGNCDVFILPSIAKSEAFGLVQIEAMAYGKPVINTNLPSGVPYVSIDHLTGLTVEPGDAKALAKAIQWMVDHEEERLEMGRKARERVKKCYQLEHMLEQVMSVYQN